ncbi:hypothetical protein AB0C18_18295 [Nonomuraea muscovyensis]|uniref:hypothetical protein n=1 Tax=Nonomuraea muscovyensis TaxID=1124761 RepID=UPI003403631F
MPISSNCVSSPSGPGSAFNCAGKPRLTQQLFHLAAHHRPEPVRHPHSEGVLEPAPRRGDHPLDLAVTERLDLLAAAALRQRIGQAAGVDLHRAHLGGRPARPPLLVVLACRPGTEGTANLRPVVLDRPCQAYVVDGAGSTFTSGAA